MPWFSRTTKVDETVEVTVSNRTIIRVLLLVFASVVLFTALKQAMHSLILIFTALFLALALNAPVHWLAKRLPRRRRDNRTLATAISFTVIVLIIGGFIASIAPPLYRQTNTFIKTAPNLANEIQDKDTSVGRLVDRYHLQDDIDKLSGQLSDRMQGVAGGVVSTAGKVTSSIFAVLTVLVLTFMMLVEGPRWMRIFSRLVPKEHHGRVSAMATDMYKVIKGYVNGQVILALTASIMLLPALLVLGIPYPAALVVIVFFCGLIPMVGHTIGAIIVTIVALFESPFAAIGILAYYILYQQIENYVIQPRIQANTTNMSPLLVFASVIIGVSFGGLFGGLVAIPIAGCLRIALLDYLRNHNMISAAEESHITTAAEYKK